MARGVSFPESASFIRPCANVRGICGVTGVGMECPAMGETPEQMGWKPSSETGSEGPWSTVHPIEGTRSSCWSLCGFIRLIPVCPVPINPPVNEGLLLISN